jgi:1-hydroxycarotenoid 3,4-desaturase
MLSAGATAQAGANSPGDSHSGASSGASRGTSSETSSGSSSDVHRHARKTSALPEQHVVVIGAGMGGLVSALLLANRGLKVTVVEAAAAPGGKMRRLVVDGAAIDAGPTVLTMRWVFEQVLHEAGFSLSDLPALTPLSVLARHAWRGHDKTLNLYADLAQSADAIAQFSNPAQAQRFLAFCDQAKRIYAKLEGPYIRSARPSFVQMVRDLGPSGLAALTGLGPFATLWQNLGRHFDDPRLRQLFARYATYCGSSPWLAPATLMLITQVELDGVWTVDGGIHALAQSLANLATRRGAHIRYNAPCERILVRDGRVCGVRLASGDTLAADAVVFNGDANALAQGLLGDEARAGAPPMPAGKRSLSAVTWAVHARTEGFALERHNVFFDDNYRSEFDDIFRHRQLPLRGTVYVCAQDRGHADRTGLARSVPGLKSFAKPFNKERLLCLLNAPADGDSRPFDVSEIAPCQQRSLDLLAQCGLRLDIQTAQQMQTTTPADFHRLFPATGGALYGPANHSWMSLFKRPGASSPLPGLYLAGGSTHPGPGLPMSAMSGRLAAATLLAHQASTNRSHRVVISGGISTPSATTANRA